MAIDDRQRQLALTREYAVRERLAVFYSRGLEGEAAARPQGEWGNAQRISEGSTDEQAEGFAQHFRGTFDAATKKRNPLTGSGPSRKIFIDADGKPAVELVRSLGLPDTVEVESGGGPHKRHFHFNPPAGYDGPSAFLFEVDTKTGQLKRQSKTGSGQFLRLPGSTHRKGGDLARFAGDPQSIEGVPGVATLTLDALARIHAACDVEQRSTKLIEVALASPREPVERHELDYNEACRLWREYDQVTPTTKAEVLNRLRAYSAGHEKGARSYADLHKDVRRAAKYMSEVGSLGAATSDPDAPESSWTILDATRLAAVPVEPPQVAGLFYLEQRTVLSGEPEVGKTWAAAHASQLELCDGHPVMWINSDDMPVGELVARLTALGVPLDLISSHFLYVQPEGKPSPEEIRHLAAVVAEREARLVIYDSFNSTMERAGLDPLATIDVEKFWQAFASPFTSAGAAVVCLDHPTKDAAGRGRYSYGSERKLSGSHVHIGMVAVEPLTREGGGRSRLVTHKDRSGFLARPHAGEFVLEAVLDITTARIVPADKTTEQPVTDERIARDIFALLRTHPEGLSKNLIEQAVRGNRDKIRATLDALVVEQSVARVLEGQRWTHYLATDYEEGEE